MFEFNSLKKLQGDFNGAFSLDKLQDGDDWMEEEDGRGSDIENQEVVHHEDTVATRASPPPEELPNISTTVFEEERALEDKINQPHVEKDVTPISKTKTLNSSPVSSVSSTDIPSAQSPLEIASKVQQGINAASKVSNFFSLDTLQEDDAWMGAGTKGMGSAAAAAAAESEDTFQAPIRCGYDVDDDSEEEEDMSPQFIPTPSRSIVEEALAATKGGDTKLKPLNSLHDLPQQSSSMSEDGSVGGGGSVDIDSSTNSNQDSSSVDKEKDIWLPQYDRGVSVKMDDTQWKPPPPLPVVNPFENTFDKEMDSHPALASNPYLSGLQLSDGLHLTREDQEAKTNKLLDLPDSKAKEAQQEGGGKHSWFRRTADRDSLRMVGAQALNSVLPSSFQINGVVDGLESGGAPSSYLSSTPHSAFGYDHYRVSSAVRATRAKIDHFGLLLEKERSSMSPYLHDLVNGRVRLSTVNKFQIAVIVVGICLIYFYYTISDYFVLT